MKKLYSYFLCFLFVAIQYQAQAQVFNRTHSNFFLTPEIGATYSDADVSTRTNLGAGLKFGYTFAKYRAVEFDLRLRYLGGVWKGQNLRNSYLTNYEYGIYNQIGTNYKDELGYTVRNFKNSNHQLAIEGLIRFNIDPNRVIAPYIFGGIARSFMRVKSDLTDADGYLYPYEEFLVPESKSYYTDLQDNKFETLVGKGNTLTGNVGLGVGFNVSDGLRIGFEHTMSFTKTDMFDGYVANKSFTKNDVYHFTNIYFQFYLRGSKNHSTDQPVRPNPPVVNNETPRNYPPTVQISNPANSPEITRNNSYYFVANTTQIFSRDQLSVTFNGQQINDYTFDQNTGRITVTRTLKPGNNVFRVFGRNNQGSDEATGTVVLEQYIPQPPQVYFTNPTNSPYTHNTTSFNLAAKALYVTGKENIQFKQNGRINSNFSFNNSTKDFTAYVVLAEGNNIFEITGSNQDGTSVATTILVYKRGNDCQQPIVAIKQPLRSPEYTSNSRYTLIGNVYNVTSKNQIQLTVNNRSFTNFTYNTADQTITATLSLLEGSNNVIVKVTNDCGTASETENIIYTQPKEDEKFPPTVSFVSPYQSNTTVSNEAYEFIASTSYITNKSQVSVRLNGSLLNTFDFDQSSQQIKFRTNLIEGNNTCTIQVTNADGNASTNTTVLYRKPNTPPTVEFTRPSVSPFTTGATVYEVIAKTMEVQNASQVTFYINGQKTTLFTFDPSNGQIKYSAVLSEGSNEFKAIVKTNSGSDEDVTTIIYRPKVVEKAPTVDFTSPSQSIEVSRVSYSLVAKTTNVSTEQQISISQNGIAITNFNFDAANQEVKFNATLKQGENPFIIKVTTAGGTAQDQVTINFKKQVAVLLPEVSWTTPEDGKTVGFVSQVFKANVKNINSKDQITITINGNPVSEFNFISISNEVNFTSRLNVGSNTAVIKVQNNDGTATDELTVIYKKPTLVCDKPVISFLTKDKSVVELKTQLTFKVSKINTAQDIQIEVNGKKHQQAIQYNNTTQEYTTTLELEKGTNVVEVKATNLCGITSSFINLNVENCKEPEITVLYPAINGSTIESSVNVGIGVTNVTSKDQISFKVNGANQTFVYDATNNRITATVRMIVGKNRFEVSATNSCGTKNYAVEVIRENCEKPTITLVKSSVSNNGQTTAQYFNIDLAVSNITSVNDVKVTLNGKTINFVYNSTSNIVSLDATPSVGKNTAVITLTNKCGSTSYTHTFTRNENPLAKPPSLSFVNPSQEVTISQAMYSFKVSSDYVTAKSQLAIKINGQSVSFNFDEATGNITFNGTMKEGRNTIKAYAVTEFGSDEQTAYVNYKKLETVASPIIVITSHANCPIQLVQGMNTISGYATNLSSIENLYLYLDGQPISNVTETIDGDKIYFSYVVSVRAASANKTLKIVAQNVTSTETKSCVLVYPGNSNVPTINTGTIKTPIKLPGKVTTTTKPTTTTETTTPTQIKTPIRTTTTPNSGTPNSRITRP